MKKEMNSSSLQVSIRSTRDAIAREGGSVHIEVQLTPPAARPHEGRRPVALALVVDRSGSMGAPAAIEPQPTAATSIGNDSGYADKLAFVKEAAIRLLDLLQDGDLFSLVTFDDRVQVIKPMTVVSGSNRARLASSIRGITTGGSTNIDGAIREGYHQFSDAIRKAFSCKLILLSDGEANVGEARPAVLGERAAGAAHNAVVTSTLGVGFDYNIALMAQLAEAGNGDFSHIEGLADLDKQLRDELAGAAEVTAANVEVHIRVPAEVAVGSNLNCYPQQSEERGFIVALGDLVRPKSFIVELATPVAMETDALKVEVTVEAQDPKGVELTAWAVLNLELVSETTARNSATDAELVRRVLGMIKADALSSAALLYDSGNAIDATVGLHASAALLDRAEALYGDLARSSIELRQARAELSDILDRVEGGTLQAMASKRTFMSASRTRKSRPVDPGDGPQP